VNAATISPVVAIRITRCMFFRRGISILLRNLPIEKIVTGGARPLRKIGVYPEAVVLDQTAKCLRAARRRFQRAATFYRSGQSKKAHNWLVFALPGSHHDLDRGF
jgi:hypothetical protein